MRPLRVHSDRHDSIDSAGVVPRTRNLGAGHRAGGCAARRTSPVRPASDWCLGRRGCFGFSLLHVSVVWYYIARKKSKNYLLHLVVPTLGFLIIAYVLFNADSLAKIGGIVWLGIGAVVFIINKLRGRGVPQLAEEPAVPGEGVSPATVASHGDLR